jgi:hypothetical protein
MAATPSCDALVQQVADLKKKIVELQKVKIDVQRANDEDIKRRFQNVFSLPHDLVAYVDSNYTYRMINDRLCRDKRKSKDEIIGRKVAEVVGPQLFSQVIKPQLDRCLSGEIVHYQGWLEYPVTGHR